MNKIGASIIVLFIAISAYGQAVNERINFDDDWSFAFGHLFDKSKDFNTGTSYFSYLSKAGYGDGAAAYDFDSRSWRKLNIPHDWAVEMEFDASASHSHGYKKVGPGFPETSIGWYRKQFKVEKSDLGKQFFIDFDGVSRNSKVWVNGHYMGTEESGYQSFSYNITDVLNFGGNNVIAVRVDASEEEGWFYEGAGIYRHVWLRKTSNLHIAKDGVFIKSEYNKSKAKVAVELDLVNKNISDKDFYIVNQVLDDEGEILSESKKLKGRISAMSEKMLKCDLVIKSPELWSLENPYLYTLITKIFIDNSIVESVSTSFGIRTIKFDSDKGFFLNGKHIKLKGTNNHQDHAGVGTAMPDELIRWRLQQLKGFGVNAIRSSHNPPTPELLNLCDEMGILVINENRLMGTSEHLLGELERLIKRDRNHPSVIVWSIGNEEWAIEGSEKGARIAERMQSFAKTLDPTRPINVAVSGAWGYGTSTTIEVMGFNYLVHGSTDQYHNKFPDTPTIGTEEGSTYTTRGIYFDDEQKQYKSAYDVKPLHEWFTIQECWKHYAERDYLSGMFIWTGFDYRGESTPYVWPSVSSYFGMMDLCGFPKDNVYYLKSWWKDQPVLHILPHWNWVEKDSIDVWVYSNAEEVELFLNDHSLGRKKMQINSHLEWNVPFEKGKIKAVSYVDGKKLLESERQTTGEARSISISSSKTLLSKNKKDLSVLTIEVLDENGIAVPVADNDIYLEIEGPGNIIGVGNGNPTSHEKDKFVDEYNYTFLSDMQFKSLDDKSQIEKFSQIKELKKSLAMKNRKILYQSFELKRLPLDSEKIVWFYKNIGYNQLVYINNVEVAEVVNSDGKLESIALDNNLLKRGKNEIVILAEPFKPKHQWDEPNLNPGIIQMKNSAGIWHRKLFNGLMQVLVETAGIEGDVKIEAYSDGLKSSELIIKVK